MLIYNDLPLFWRLHKVNGNVYCCNKNRCNAGNGYDSSDGSVSNNEGTSCNGIHSNNASNTGATDASGKDNNPSTTKSAMLCSSAYR